MNSGGAKLELPAAKKPSLTGEALAFVAIVENETETEGSMDRARAMLRLGTAQDYIERLAARICDLESKVDGWALNRSSSSRLPLATDALMRDAANRHPSLWGLIKRRRG